MTGKLVWIAVFLLSTVCLAQQAGRELFTSRCAVCHGGDGRGGERAPDITRRIGSESELTNLIRNGLPAKGMPPISLSGGESTQLVRFVRSLAATAEPASSAVLNASNFDKQLRDAAGLHLLHKNAAGAWVEAKTASGVGEWPSYHGEASGNRHSVLREIDTSNVARLAPRWLFPIAGTERLQVTPVVSGGVMYVTAVNEAYALDASTGRSIWHYQRPRTKGLAGDAASGINRGVALHGDRVLMVTDNAHLIALGRADGRLLWDVEMADARENYGATSAPLVVKDLVISGISGGDEGARGFVAAYRVSTGERV